MRIGIYGGTFNPPHTGHIKAVRAAREALGLDRVLVIPAGIPPHKRLSQDAPPDAARLEMARLAFGGLNFVQVSATEMERGGISYTVDTLESVKVAHPAAQLWLIVGTDMFLTIQNWYRPERIFSLCRVAVVPRGPQELDKIRLHAAELAREFGAQADIIESPPIEISSSQVRALLASGKGTQYLAPTVCKYIAEHGYYAAAEAGKEKDGGAHGA